MSFFARGALPWVAALAAALCACSNSRLRSAQEEPRELVVSLAGEGEVQSNPEGIDCGARCASRFPHGQTVVLVARAAHPGGFAGWSGACAGTDTCQVVLDAAKEVSARFRTKLSVTVEGNGRVGSDLGGLDCGASCTSLLDPGLRVKLTPSPAAGFSFAGWSGACAGSGPCTVSTDRSSAVVARFSPLAAATHQLVVNLFGTGSGVVTSLPAGIQCGTACNLALPEGAVVKLTAQQAASSTFAGWSGGCTGTAPTCELTMTSSVSVNARFEPDQLPCGWSRRFGGTWHDRAGSLAIAADDTLLIGGSVFGPVNFGAGLLSAPSGVYSAFAATFRPDGSAVNAFARGATGAVTLGSSAVWAPGGRAVLYGAFSGTVDLGDGPRSSSIGMPGLFRSFVGSYSPAGVTHWVRPLASTTTTTPDGFGSVAVGQDGTVAVTGEFFEPASFGGPTTFTPQESDLFVAGYGADGGFLWARAAGADAYDRGLQIASRPGNAWVVTGGFSGASNFGGGAYPASTSDEAVVASYGNNGAHLFDRAFGADGGTRLGHAVAVAPDGDLVVVGGFTEKLQAGATTLTAAGLSDAFVVRLSSTGAVRWAAQLGGPAWEEAFGVAVDSAGAVAVVGGYYANTTFGGVPAPNRGSEDYFVARYSATGAALGTTTGGGTGRDHIGGVAFDRTGNLLLSGEFEKTIDLGFGALTSAGGTDVFLACLGR